jgi:hypothetical protein
MNPSKFNKKKGGYVALDNPENSISKNIIPAIDEGGYLIWKNISINTFVITPHDGIIWVIVAIFSDNKNIKNRNYTYFTLENIWGIQKTVTSYDFRVLVIFKHTEISYKIGLITGYNNNNNSLYITSSLDDNGIIYGQVFSAQDSKKTNIIRVIKGLEYNDKEIQDALSQLQNKLPNISNKKELINLRIMNNNNFVLSDISSYADISKQYNLNINFGLPSAFGYPQSAAFGSPQSAAFGYPQSAAFGSPSAAFGSPSAAFGLPSAFGSPQSAAFGSDNNVKMANMILNIYLELLANETIYAAILSDNTANITKRKNIITTLKKNLEIKANNNKILTKEYYYNIQESDTSRLLNILFYLFDITDINEAKKKIIHLQDIIIPALDTLKNGGFILFNTVKQVYNLDAKIYKSEDFFDGNDMLNGLFLLLRKLNISRPSVRSPPLRSPPLRFGPEGGGLPLYKNIGNKEILGKNRIIFKTAGSNKEYIKNKGMFIPVSEYKKQQKHK